MKVFVLGLVFGSLLGCTSHKSVVQKFYKAVFEGDAETMRPLLLDQQMMAASYFEEAARKGEFKGCKIERIEENPSGDIASITKELPEAKETKEFAVVYSCKKEEGSPLKTENQKIWVSKINGKHKVIMEK